MRLSCRSCLATCGWEPLGCRRGMMATLIGGLPPIPGRDNLIVGGPNSDIIFGDPFTTGNTVGVVEVGGPLRAGQSGRDSILAGGGDDFVNGDAWAITGTGHG